MKRLKRKERDEEREISHYLDWKLIYRLKEREIWNTDHTCRETCFTLIIIKFKFMFKLDDDSVTRHAHKIYTVFKLYTFLFCLLWSVVDYKHCVKRKIYFFTNSSNDKKKVKMNEKRESIDWLSWLLRDEIQCDVNRDVLCEAAANLIAAKLFSICCSICRPAVQKVKRWQRSSITMALKKKEMKKSKVCCLCLINVLMISKFSSERLYCFYMTVIISVYLHILLANFWCCFAFIVVWWCVSSISKGV